MSACPRCGTPLAQEQDANGPRLFCRCCAWQRDLLAPPPEELAKMLKPELPHSRHDYFREDGAHYTVSGPGRPRKPKKQWQRKQRREGGARLPR